MAFGRDDVCEHGSLKRKCDSCALLEADKRIALYERALRIIAGREQCVDKFMSNVEVAIAALDDKG